MKLGYQHHLSCLQQVVSSVLLSWRIAQLILLLFNSCSAQTTYYVTPTLNTSCPGQPCHTLSQYIADGSFKNLPDNTTIEFLPGNHTLEQTISVTNLTSLALHGNSSSLPEITSRIVCTWPAGFVFTDITELYITSLAFISCGHNDSTAVNIISVHQCNISSISTGGYNESSGGALYIQNSDVILTGSIFQNCTVGYGGGVVSIWNSTLTVTDSTFQNHSGGVLSVVNSNITVTNNSFQNNTADYGSGEVLYARASNLTITDNIFQSNSASDNGGVFYVIQNSILIITNNTFQNNTVHTHDGGVCYVLQSNLIVTNNTFYKNSASADGGVLYAITSNLTVTDNSFQNSSAFRGGVLFAWKSNLTVTDSLFQNNSAFYGGVSYAFDSSLTVADNTFQNNSAVNTGGIIVMESCNISLTDNNFTDSSAKVGGAISIGDHCTVRMYGSNIIENNRAQYGGGIAVLDSKLQLLENTIFENNRGRYGGGLYAHNTECNGSALFTKNIAFEGGGGIYASKSTFFLTENTTTIKNNSAINGGGLLLLGNSKIYLHPNIAVYFISNSANRTGGAIKVEQNNPLSYCLTAGYSDCFFQTQSQMNQSDIRNITQLKHVIDSLNVTHIVHFGSNSAAEEGNDLYGGDVDNCKMTIIKHPHFYHGPSPSGYVFDIITSSTSGNKLNISSDPLHICTCVDDLINCTNFYHPKPVYPGGTLEVLVIALGQRNGTSDAAVQVTDLSDNIKVNRLEISQPILSSCTSVNYTIQSRAVGTTQNMTLHAEGPCPPNKNNTLTVTVEILSCPPGFQLSETQPLCICAERLQCFTDKCFIENATVLRTQDAKFWVGYNESRGLILHPHCPFDYCTSEKTYLAVSDSDKQCNYNRSGLLCGRCNDNLSLALGSSRCLSECSNSYLTLLAVFMFAGIALVVLLLVLRLTVAAGTINSLIFYANVTVVNSAIFFQPQSISFPTALIAKVLTVFIAWLNLDLGIETCFYNGMDAYVKTWLQFAFPLYVWVLVGMVIIGSHYSGRVARMFGNNPVAVLATLFLLSYAKLLRTCIAALSYTSLQYPNNSHIAVWLYDGNVRYLSGKHIPLFTVALICLIFLVLPYTMLLIFGQWLQARSELKIFSCINNRYVKSFLDAYHAPYTDKHRYWTGLMLLLRFILCLILALNALGDPSVTLIATAFITATVLTLPTIFSSRIYKMWSISLLETSFILNLTVLAVATLYIQPRRGNQNAATFTSVGIAFATFIGIVIYHSIQQLKGTRLWRRVCLRHDYMRVPPTDVDSGPEDPPGSPVNLFFVSGSAPTQTVIEIRNSQLREPCMGTD